MSRPLEGTVALVTGASAGVGRELALGLAEAGAAVGVLARRPDVVQAVAEECRRAGVDARAVPADVTSWDEVRAAVAEVETALGPVHLLVNCAGRIEQREVPLWEADVDDWLAVVAANLHGPFLMSRAVLPGMLARGGGRVVNLSSGAALRDWEIHSAYTASKTALARLTGAIARAGGPQHVHAFDVAPGHVRTAMTEGMAMHADKTDDEWTPPGLVVALTVAIAQGRLDRLSGRHLRADKDTVESLLREGDRILAADARTLRLRPYGPEDPLG